MFDFLYDITICAKISVVFFVCTLLIAVFVAVRKLDIVKPLRIFGIGLFFADCIVLVPILAAVIKWNDKIDIATALSAAVMNAAQLVTLNASYETLLPQASDWTLFYFIPLCILSPIVWGGVVLTLLESFSSWLAYRIFRLFVPVYFFSELTENSFMLAKSIKSAEKTRKKKCLCIFCDIHSGTSTELKEEAKDNAFLLFKNAETAYVKNPKHSQTFFELSENQDENLAHTRQLIDCYAEKYVNADFSAVKIYLFSEQEEAPLLLSSTDKKGIPVVLVNRHRFIANDLLFNHPLYEVLSETEKTMNVLIIGAGKIGTELLKTVLWCGQLGSEYPLKLTVIDKDAEAIKNTLQLGCPEFFNGEYNITFLQTDVTDHHFLHYLSEHCADANYVCICTGDDERNIQTALHVRAHYLRKDVTASKKPFIAVEVKNRIKNAIVPEFTAKTRERLKKTELNSHKAMNYHLMAFGGDNQLYSTQIPNSPLEKLAMNVHFAYELAFSEGKASEKDSRKNYYFNETNIRSDRANALHIRYKLFLLGYDIKPAEDSSDAEKKESGELIKALQKKIDTELLQLQKIEHERWNAFMRGEGWQSASMEQAEKAGNHKIARAKLHACLCSWERLDAFSKFDPKFKEYDKQLVQQIPVLLGLTEGKENTSGVRYMLTKR